MMCFQDTSIQEHCRCVCDWKPVEYCDLKGAPGHDVECRNVVVDTPCEKHPDPRPVSPGVSLFQRHADLEEYEDYQQHTKPELHSSHRVSLFQRHTDLEEYEDYQQTKPQLEGPHRISMFQRHTDLEEYEDYHRQKNSERQEEDLQRTSGEIQHDRGEMATTHPERTPPSPPVDSRCVHEDAPLQDQKGVQQNAPRCMSESQPSSQVQPRDLDTVVKQNDDCQPTESRLLSHEPHSESKQTTVQPARGLQKVLPRKSSNIDSLGSGFGRLKTLFARA